MSDENKEVTYKCVDVEGFIDNRGYSNRYPITLEPGFLAKGELDDLGDLRLTEEKRLTRASTMLYIFKGELSKYFELVEVVEEDTKPVQTKHTPSAKVNLSGTYSNPKGGILPKQMCTFGGDHFICVGPNPLDNECTVIVSKVFGVKSVPSKGLLRGWVFSE